MNGRVPFQPHFSYDGPPPGDSYAHMTAHYASQQQQQQHQPPHQPPHQQHQQSAAFAQIDPRLGMAQFAPIHPLHQTTHDYPMAQRMSSVEKSLDEIKAMILQSRVDERRDEDETENEAPPPKKKKKLRQTKKKSLKYILQHAQGLDEHQTEVRDQLMRYMTRELTKLTGRNKSANLDTSEEPPEGSSASSTTSTAAESTTTLRFDFSFNVNDSPNDGIIERAADLVWSEQSNPVSTTCTLTHKNVKFTRSDLIHFGKGTFRSWKRDHRQSVEPQAASLKARNASAARQALRRSHLKTKRLTAVDEYKKVNDRDVAFICETEWMSDEVSCLDTSDDEKKAAHRTSLVNAARLDASETDKAVWEIVRPGFQTFEVQQIKDELDRIVVQLAAAANAAQKKKARPTVPRVRLGSTHNRIPTKPIWPFMMQQIWYDQHIAGDEEKEQGLTVHAKNPDGFSAVGGL